MLHRGPKLISCRNYTSFDNLQILSPRDFALEHDGPISIPLECMINLRSPDDTQFDRLIPSTRVTLKYDKFNALRLHSTFRPLSTPSAGDDPELSHICRYTVSRRSLIPICF